MARVVVFLAAVIAHIALVALLATSRPVREQRSTGERQTILVFLTPEPIAQTVEPPASSQAARSLRWARPAPDRVRTAPADSSAITEPVPPGSAPPPAPSIDWSRESQLVAERQVDALEASRRQARGFTPGEQDRNRVMPSPRAREFGWDRAHTQRIEPIPSGGTLIRLNDRCAVVLSGFIFPVCTIGKIQARGDLFEHMDDTPQLGDPK